MFTPLQLSKGERMNHQQRTSVGEKPHSKEPPTRHAILASRVRALCPTHQRVERVTDVFMFTGDDGTFLLACGTRRTAGTLGARR